MCRREFDADETMPRMSEPGGCAIAIESRRGSSSCVAWAKITRFSDKNGRFVVDMPFSGQVGAWATHRSYYSGYDEKNAGLYDSVDGLEIVLLDKSRVPASVVRLEDPDGNRLSGATIEVHYPSHRRHRSNRFYDFTADEKGVIDTSELTVGDDYHVFFVDPPAPTKSFRHAGEATFVVRDYGIRRSR